MPLLVTYITLFPKTNPPHPHPEPRASRSTKTGLVYILKTEVIRFLRKTTDGRIFFPFFFFFFSYLLKNGGRDGGREREKGIRMCERVGFWTVQERVMCFIEFVDDDAGGGGNLGIFAF